MTPKPTGPCPTLSAHEGISGYLCSLLLSPASQLFPEPPQEGAGDFPAVSGQDLSSLLASIHQELSWLVSTLWADSGLVVAVIYLDHQPECRGWEQLGCGGPGEVGPTSPFPLSLQLPGPEGCLLPVQSP